MANEMVHGTVGTTMTQAEFEAIGLHVLNSQATGDLIYASSLTQLSRLGIGATNTVLRVAGGIPAWSATLAGLTLTAPTLNGTTTLGSTPIFDAGAGSVQINTTAQYGGLIIQSTRGSYPLPSLTVRSASGTPSAYEYGELRFDFLNSTPANITFARVEVTSSIITAGAESCSTAWYHMNGGTENYCMYLTAAGLLGLDLAGTGAGAPSLFDEYDDALLLRQGIQQNNRELLADIGVLDRKDTGSGYMMNIQPMVRLLAGGIYQTRELIENTKEELINMIEHLESKLMLPEAR